MGEGFLLDCNRRRGHIWFVINSAAPARLSYISKDHFSAEWSSELHTHGCAELNSCLDLMLQESSESLAGHEAACQHLLEVLLIRLGRQQAMSLSGEAPGPGPRASQECEFIRRYIDNHFKEDLTLDHLAKLAHLNKYYLSHSFRREFGTSPINYLISRRVDESRFLLRRTDYSLSLIAEILGFSSLSYFSQCFHRVEGISPTEYRKQNREK